MRWCHEHSVDFMPVVFPGFSWHHLKAKDPLDAIPRLKGQFLWSQFTAIRSAGATMADVAMFDEVDEGTAIFKCTNNPPVGSKPFLTYEGLPSDHDTGALEVLWKAARWQEWLERLAPDRRGGVLGTA
jgi:hypothetical protein